MSCMSIHKHLTYSKELSLVSFTTFTVTESQRKRHLKLCTQGKYTDYCKQLNETSTIGHDAKKAREQNMKEKRQESVSN